MSLTPLQIANIAIARTEPANPLLSLQLTELWMYIVDEFCDPQTAVALGRYIRSVYTKVLKLSKLENNSHKPALKRLKSIGWEKFKHLWPVIKSKLPPSSYFLRVFPPLMDRIPSVCNDPTFPRAWIVGTPTSLAPTEVQQLIIPFRREDAYVDVDQWLLTYPNVVTVVVDSSDPEKSPITVEVLMELPHLEETRTPTLVDPRWPHLRTLFLVQQCNLVLCTESSPAFHHIIHRVDSNEERTFLLAGRRPLLNLQTCSKGVDFYTNDHDVDLSTLPHDVEVDELEDMFVRYLPPELETVTQWVFYGRDGDTDYGWNLAFLARRPTIQHIYCSTYAAFDTDDDIVVDNPRLTRVTIFQEHNYLVECLGYGWMSSIPSLEEVVVETAYPLVGVPAHLRITQHPDCIRELKVFKAEDWVMDVTAPYPCFAEQLNVISPRLTPYEWDWLQHLPNLRQIKVSTPHLIRRLPTNWSIIRNVSPDETLLLQEADVEHLFAHPLTKYVSYAHQVKLRIPQSFVLRYPLQTLDCTFPYAWKVEIEIV